MALYDALKKKLEEGELLVRLKIVRHGAGDSSMLLTLFHYEEDSGDLTYFEVEFISGLTVLGVHNPTFSDIPFEADGEDETDDHFAFNSWVKRQTGHFAQPKEVCLIEQTFEGNLDIPAITRKISIGNLSLLTMLLPIWERVNSDEEANGMSEDMFREFKHFVFKCRDEARKFHPTLC